VSNGRASSQCALSGAGAGSPLCVLAPARNGAGDTHGLILGGLVDSPVRLLAEQVAVDGCDCIVVVVGSVAVL
jgi:hypothetical protein